MQQEEKELRLNQLRLIVIVMTLIFAFMLVYTIYFLIDYNDKYSFFEKATAEVIEHQEIDGKEYDLLSYKVDGNEFRITTEYESKNAIGDTITIYYDTNNPLGVVYSLDSRRIWLPILTGIFAIANVGLCAMYILIRKGVLGNKNVKKKEIVNVELSDNEPIKVSKNTNTENKIASKSSKVNNTNKNATKTTTKTVIKTKTGASTNKSSQSNKTINKTKTTSKSQAKK